jgi:hypothetical protein
MSEEVTITMEESPPWEDNNHLAVQEIHLLLWYLKIHYHVHINLQLDPIPPSYT